MIALQEKKYKDFLLPVSKAGESEPLSLRGLEVSEEEYWKKYYEYAGDNDYSFEWNNGVLEEKPMGDHLSYLMSDWFHSLLKEYLKVHPDATIFGADLGFRLELSGKTVIRRPDMSLILNTNPVPFYLLDRSYQGVFDMCFEFLSDSEDEYAERDTVEKRSEYAAGGVKEYFILDRLGIETAFYRLNSRGFYSPIRPVSGGVIRSKVLPGFQFRIMDLYNRPGFEEMAEDPLYKHFVLKNWQAERSRADEAEKRAGKAEKKAEAERKRAGTSEKKAEAERKRAGMAEKKAEAERKRAGNVEKTALKLAEKLREMGIDPESL